MPNRREALGDATPAPVEGRWRPFQRRPGRRCADRRSRQRVAGGAELSASMSVTKAERHMAASVMITLDTEAMSDWGS